MATTVLLDLQLKLDNLEGALADIHHLLIETRAFAGCLGVEVVVAIDDPAHVILVERWESVEHNATYQAWRAHNGATTLGQLLAAPPKIGVFRAATAA